MFVWSGHKCPQQRVLKSHRSKMNIIYMQSWKQSALLLYNNNNNNNNNNNINCYNFFHLFCIIDLFINLSIKHSFYCTIYIMACNGVLNPQQKYPTSPKNFKSLPQSSNFNFAPLRLEMAASAFFTHGYFQQAHVHIPEAITTD